MGKRSCNGSERQSIRDGECGRDEQRAVRLIFLFIECGIRIDDPGNVVGLPKIIERTARRNWHKLAVPHIGVLDSRFPVSKVPI